MFTYPCVGPVPKIKMSFRLLSTRADELISALMVTTFLPKLPSGSKQTPVLSNPIPYSEYLFLSISAILVMLTAPNKTFTSVGWILTCVLSNS